MLWHLVICNLLADIQINLQLDSNGMIVVRRGAKPLFETYRSDNNNRVWYLKNGGMILPSDKLNYISPEGHRYQYQTSGIFDPRLVVDSNSYLVFDTGSRIPGEYIPERDGDTLFRSFMAGHKFSVVHLESGLIEWQGSEVTHGVPVGITNEKLTCIKIQNLRNCLINPRVVPVCFAIEYSTSKRKVLRKRLLQNWNLSTSAIALFLMRHRPVEKSTALWRADGNVSIMFDELRMSSGTVMIKKRK